MTIFKTKAVGDITIIPAVDSGGPVDSNNSYPTVKVTYVISIDDIDDTELPIVTHKVLVISKFNSEGEVTSIIGEDALVITMCNAVWS
jgi:hypothetical protein|tara:strand:+ start:12026 stop:12289 length:264 start_codon:yes stop_codon:yes gene_type:complete